MTRSSILKKVQDAYPEIFISLPKPQLRLVKNALIYAAKLSVAEKILTTDEHKALLKELGGSSLSQGQCLKAYRLRAELTQLELAKRSQISQANISAMESDKRSIGLRSAQKLAQILNCDFERLLGKPKR